MISKNNTTFIHNATPVSALTAGGVALTKHFHPLDLSSTASDPSVPNPINTLTLLSNVNHSIYKSDNITSITKFLENCNPTYIINPYSQPSTYPQRSVISSICHATISSEDNMFQPLTI